MGFKEFFRQFYAAVKWVVTDDRKAWDTFMGQPLTPTETEYNNEGNEMARVVTNTDGSGTLFVDGQEVKTYSRARDAKRGAARLGYTL